MSPSLKHRFGGCERGLAALEFAMVAPFMIILLLGGFELSRFLLVQQKAEKTAFSIADVTAQYAPDEGPDIDEVFAAVDHIMKPHSFQADGLVILTSVFNEEGSEQTKVRWQCDNGGALQETSRIGDVDDAAHLPADFLLDDKDNVIITEVFYRFRPLFSTIFTQPFVIYRTAMFRPRLGALTSTPAC